jgi:hypothetical protein
MTRTTSRFGDLHSKTYEIELLISGALVFGLISVPSQVERAFEYWLTRLDGLTLTVAMYLIVYADLVAYALLGTFILHLSLRGYWVALLGLESVWPEGWLLDKLKLGPNSRQVVERELPTLSTAIDRADDRASLVFAAGTLLALLFLYSVLGVLFGLLVASGITTVVPWPGEVVFFSVLGGVAGTALVVSLVDRYLGARIGPQSIPGRVLAVLVKIAMATSPMRLMGPIQFVFQTHVGERKVTTLLLAAMTVLGAVMVGSFASRLGAIRIDGWKFFDDDVVEVMASPRYYRSMTMSRDGQTPTIDADVMSGSTMRVYLPYRPRRHNPRLEKACPGQIVGADGRSNAAAAACVGGLYTLAIDGQPVTSQTFDFTREQESDFLGVFAYVDMQSLTPGRHELRIEGPGREGEPPVVTRIPFVR